MTTPHGKTDCRPAEPTLMCPLDHISAVADGDRTVLQARKTVRPEEAFISLPLSTREQIDIFPGSFYFEAVRQSLNWLKGPKATGSLDLAELKSARYQAMATVGDEIQLRAVVQPWEPGGPMHADAVFRRSDGQLLVRMNLVFAANSRRPDQGLGPEQFMQWIPYRDPMLLVDRVVLHEPGRLIHTLKAITHSDPVFHRREDGRPLDAYAYPSGLVVNSWGQSAVLLARSSVDTKGTISTASARQFITHRNVYPGDVLRHVARLDQTMYDTTFFLSGETYAGDDLVASGSLVMTVQDPTAYTSKMSTPSHRS
ncbi:3-hydroxyacyl-ACP dehydratase FabZ family protein [Streptomyces sp. 8N616]|uniref:3-hydroxyacyl-ACP dehydratase FabZ family protein n=1 Tax=Streptomyces sp. 8N616 TaxID=3457414 RepID=UPI003FCFE7BE